MFEQTFVGERTISKKPIIVLLSLLFQITALIVLVLAPLIYTRVLPRAELKSVFAAPTPPPPPTLPKPAVTVRSSVVIPHSFRPILITDVIPIRRVEIADITAPSVITDAFDLGSTSLALGVAAVRPPAPLPPPTVKKAEPRQLNVSHMEESQLLHKVQPAYPPLAKHAVIQGSVEFSAIIGKTGSIERLQLLHGHPLLVKAAEEAILQWKYKPTLLNGEPVDVITNITVNFTLTSN